jgi:eukaryotic-like serine/threonine-protein kinase
MLTPAYASPEQVKGEPITTASDVYSLGVVLYELLAGRHPYRSDPRSDQLLREICESEPEKPSTAAKKVGERSDSGASSSSAAAPKLTAEKLSKHLRGDLDNIVLMALRKEPQRRYASVEQFAEDIRRYLGHLPVIARKDTATYSASKFVLRHKAGVAATAIVLLVFLLAFVVTIREARIARRQAVLAQEQHARAELRFNDVRKLANSLIFEIHDSIQDLPGATKARELLIKRALEYLDSLSQESADPALQRELATAYERIAFVQGNNASANIADLSGASASYAKGLAIRESLVAANPNDVNLRIELFANYFESFAVLESTGDFDGLLRSLQKAWPLADAVHPGTRERPEFNMSGLHFLTGNALQKKGDFRSALENYQEAARFMEPFALAPQASLRSRWYLAGDHVLIGRMLAELGHASEARSFLDKGLRTLRKLSDENPTNATLREGLGDYYDFSSHALVETGDLEGALALLRLQKRIFDALTSADPGNKMASFDSASVDLDTSEILLRQGKLTKAAPLIRTSLSIYQKANPANKYWYAVTMGQSYLDLGQLNAARAEQGEALSKKRELWKEAVSCYQKALDLRSTGPGQRDFNGHDQFDEIHRELAKATAALARLDN